MIKNTALVLLIIYFIILLCDYSFAIDRIQLPPIEAKDEGGHIFQDPDYFEMWYFDGTSDSGYNFRSVFLLRSKDNLLNYEWRLNVFTPNGKEISSKQIFGAEEVEIAKDRCQVKMGNNYIYYEENRYIIHYESIDISMHMELEPLVEGFGDKKISTDKIKNRGFFWLVPVPRGRLVGSLKLKDRDIVFKGLGYHEHNWGTRFVNKEGYEINKWIWGWILSDNFTIVFVDVFCEKDIHSTFVFVTDNNRIRKFLFSPTANIKYNNATDHGIGPKMIKINLDGYGQVSLVLKRAYTVTGTPSSKVYRCISKAFIALTIDNKLYKEHGRCINETLADPEDLASGMYN